MFFKVNLVDGKFGVGEESIEFCLFEEDEIFWLELVFFSVEYILCYYFVDCKSN